MASTDNARGYASTSLFLDHSHIFSHSHIGRKITHIDTESGSTTVMITWLNPPVILCLKSPPWASWKWHYIWLMVHCYPQTIYSPQEPNVLACIPTSTSQDSQEYSTKDTQYVDTTECSVMRVLVAVIRWCSGLFCHSKVAADSCKCLYHHCNNKKNDLLPTTSTGQVPQTKIICYNRIRIKEITVKNIYCQFATAK